MTLTKQIAKYIHPVLKKLGFVKVKHYWRLENEGFYFVAAVGSRKHGEIEDVLDFGLGVFSVEIEELYGVRYALESPMSDMPGGIPLCHFVSSLYQLDENLNWDEKQGNYRFFLRDADVSEEFLAISEKLNILLPRFIKTFSSVEKLVECHQRRIGAWWMSTQSKLYAATGCIILGRYDEAEKLIESAIKLGSAPIMKETAVRFRAIIRERRASPN